MSNQVIITINNSDSIFREKEHKMTFYLRRSHVTGQIFAVTDIQSHRYPISQFQSNYWNYCVDLEKNEVVTSDKYELRMFQNCSPETVEQIKQVLDKQGLGSLEDYLSKHAQEIIQQHRRKR